MESLRTGRILEVSIKVDIWGPSAEKSSQLRVLRPQGPPEVPSLAMKIQWKSYRSGPESHIPLSDLKFLSPETTPPSHTLVSFLPLHLNVHILKFHTYKKLEIIVPGSFSTLELKISSRVLLLAFSERCVFLYHLKISCRHHDTSPLNIYHFDTS